VTRWAAAGLLSALAAIVAGGCSSTPTSEGTKPSTEGKKGGGKGALTALEAKGTGTLKGKITLDGAAPEVAKLTADVQKQMAEKDKDHCLSEKAPADDKQQQTWRIKDGGVGDVFVWLKAPDGKFFKIDPAQIDKKEVVLDQPFCAFEPHAFVLFPAYRDPQNPKEFKETGQQLVVKNSAPIDHNTNYNATPDIPGDNKLIPSKGDMRPKDIVPTTKPIIFKCTIHPWMTAYARAFDHPYATVSKEDGTYEIKNVPTGVELQVVAWHPEAGFLDGGDAGKTVTLEDGKPVDFKLKVR
jgi:hypothetical protein